MRKSFAICASSAIRNDPKASLLLGDIGTFAFKELIETFPNRVMNVGILEQSMIGVAAGMSLMGMNPIIHTISPFLIERALEQIKIDFGYQRLSCNLVSVGGSIDYSKLGATHHCPGDVAILNTIERSKIFLPGTPREFESLFQKNFQEDGIKYFRLVEHHNSIDFSQGNEYGRVLSRGKLAAVVVFGNLLDNVLQATNDLDVSVIYLNSMEMPCDEVIQELKRHSKIFCIEPFYELSSCSFLFPLLQDNQIRKLRFVGFPRRFIYDYDDYDKLMEKAGLNKEQLRKIIMKELL